MPSGVVEAVRLRRAQVARAAEVLARAFDGDVMYAHLFRDRAESLRVLTRLFHGVIVYNLAWGEVWTTPEVTGVACWTAPGRLDATWWRSLRTGYALQRAVAAFRPEARAPFLAGEAHEGQVHRRLMHGPHWYLWALGVAPERQGEGVGGTLLAPMLGRADAEGLPCYLETQTEANVAFYARRGFEVLAADELPGQPVSVPMWYMARDPRA